jgi:hypothetical protein
MHLLKIINKNTDEKSGSGSVSHWDGSGELELEIN